MDLSGIHLSLPSLGTEVKQLTGILPPHTLPELAQEGQLTEPARAELTLRKEDGRYLVAGWVQGRIQLSCARCLGEFTLELAGQMEREFKVGRDPANMEREMEMMADLVYLEDGMLSIRDLVEEELVLLLPMVPLCKEMCRGLCPGCGADLNQESCRCGTPLPDGPWAALDRLKNSDKG